MQKVSRRDFFVKSALGVTGGYLSAGIPPLTAKPLGLPIGFQLYPVRDRIATDFPGLLREFAAAGYQACEMCSPAGYGGPGFGSLAKMKGSEIRKIINDTGLQCESSHFNFKELNQDLPGSIAFAKDLGLKQMVISSFSVPRDNTTMDAWKKAADTANKMGVDVQKAGMQLGFHNHNMEFQKIDGVLIYDELMKTFDPKLVKMQFQVAVISLGYKAADYFKKYPGRFISIHLQDWKGGERESVAIGTGKVDWKELFAAAKTAGVKNYFVEVDPEDMKPSAPFLRNLQVS